MASLNLGIRRTPDGVTLKVRLTPKSSRDAVEGVEEHDEELVLKARVRAVPESGRANAALETLIADWLGVPRSRVAVVQGGKSRVKQVAIEGDDAELAERIAARLGELDK